jgi:hypothetical protein
MRAIAPFRLTRPALIAGICTLLAAGCGGSATTPPTQKSTKDNFEKVKDGMSEKEVTDIMGSPAASVELDPKNLKGMLPKGVEIPEIPAIPLPGVALPKFTMKSWEEGDTVFEVVLQDGKVVGKNSGPKKGSEKAAAKVTKENADKIKIGMTKAEVEAILGPGKVSAGQKIEGFSGEVVIWEGDAGAITIGFTNDKVTLAATFKAK